MPHILGPFDTADAEPSRGAFRWVFLDVLREELPGILPDLWESCIAPARAVLATAGPQDDPSNLLDVTCCRLAKEAREAEIFQKPGGGKLHMRLYARTDSRAELWQELVQWAAGYRLTDLGGIRNGWLLSTALETLLEWCTDHPEDKYPTDPPGQLVWCKPGIGTVGPRDVPAQELRFRGHTEPAPESALGPLARDWVWLVNYVCTNRARNEFAPGIARAAVLQQVRAAARRIGFELPDPMRPAMPEDDTETTPNR